MRVRSLAATVLGYLLVEPELGDSIKGRLTAPRPEIQAGFRLVRTELERKPSLSREMEGESEAVE